VVCVAGGQDVGIAGREEDGVVECEVRIALQERRVASFVRVEVKCVEAVWRGLGTADVGGLRVVEGLERICEVKTSTSSRTMAWMRRFVDRCRDGSKRYSGNAVKVSISDVQLEGRKMWTCIRLVFTQSSISFLVVTSSASIGVSARRNCVVMCESRTCARRGTLK